MKIKKFKLMVVLPLLGLGFLGISACGSGSDDTFPSLPKPPATEYVNFWINENDKEYFARVQIINNIVTLPTNPQPTETHNFAGWYINLVDEIPFVETAVGITRDVFASFVEGTVYEITFVSGEADLNLPAELENLTISLAYGRNIHQALYNRNLLNFSEIGFIFAGFYLKSNILNLNDTMPADNIILYATWDEVLINITITGSTGVTVITDEISIREGTALISVETRIQEGNYVSFDNARYVISEIIVISGTIQNGLIMTNITVDVRLTLSSNQIAANIFIENHASALTLNITTIRIEDREIVEEAQMAFGLLTQEVQALVSVDAGFFTGLLERIANLQADVDAAELFEATHASVLELTVETVTMADRQVVEEAQMEFNNLSTEQQVLVRVDEEFFIGLLERIDDIFVVAGFESLHWLVLSATVQTITIDYRVLVEDAQANFNTLSVAQQGLLSVDAGFFTELLERIAELEEQEVTPQITTITIKATQEIFNNNDYITFAVYYNEASDLEGILNDFILAFHTNGFFRGFNFIRPQGVGIRGFEDGSNINIFLKPVLRFNGNIYEMVFLAIVEEIVENLSFVLHDDKTATLIGQGTWAANATLRIPTFYQGHRVTHIADRAFANISIRDIFFPLFLQEIGNEAFREIYMTQTVIENLPNLRRIGSRAFSNARWVVSHTLILRNLPQLEVIESDAFINSHLVSVSMENLPMLSLIDNGVFNNNANLINVSLNNVNYQLIWGTNIFSTINNRTIYMLGTWTQEPVWWVNRETIFAFPTWQHASRFVDSNGNNITNW